MSSVLANYSTSRDNNFNLIRFIAATLVLYSHSFALAIGTGDAEPLRHSLGMTWGSIAVDIFFITSGFLIAGSYFSKKNIIAFVWARVLRIYPALVVAMIFCTFIVGTIYTKNSLLNYFQTLSVYKYFIKNSILFFGVDYKLPGVFGDIPYKDAVNGSIWTLPAEVRMYVILAFFCVALALIQKLTNWKITKFFFLFVAITSIFINVYNHFIPFSSSNFIKLFSMFFVGTAFYVYRDSIILSLRFFLFITSILLLAIVNKEVFFMIYSISVAYVVFFLAYVPSGKIRKFNDFGDYSYGIYIYAFPVQQSVAATVPNVSVGIMIILSFTITFMLSYLSWHFLEKKCLEMKGSYVMLEKAILKFMEVFFQIFKRKKISIS